MPGAGKQSPTCLAQHSNSLSLHVGAINALRMDMRAQQRCLHACQQRSVACVPAGCVQHLRVKAGFRVKVSVTRMQKGKRAPHRVGLPVALPLVAIACMCGVPGMAGMSSNASCTLFNPQLPNHTEHLRAKA